MTLVLLFLLASCSSLKELPFESTRPPQKVLNSLWTKNFDPGQESGNLPVNFGAPAIYQGILYMGTPNGMMRALNLSTGQVLWQKKDGEAAYSSAPVASKNLLLYGNIQGRVFARHRITGKLFYSIDLGEAIEAQPILSQGRAFFHLRNHKLVSLDPKTGKILWSYQRSVPYVTTIQRVSRPTFYKKRLYVGFADGFVAAFNIQDGSILWERKVDTGAKFVDVDNTPVFRGSDLFINSVSGKLLMLDPETGEVKRRLKFSSTRAPRFEGNTMVIGTREGYLLRLNKNFRVVRGVYLTYGAVTSTALWKDHLIVGTTDGKVHVVDRLSFELKETFDLGSVHSAVYAPIQMEEGKLALYSSRNRLYVFH